ncbi:hypothetical protein EI94DRAFT_1213544 [Lactarius quietus]|nr:hypothetical protein EI94DRAFT_1213544 [Lactarius quietus]
MDPQSQPQSKNAHADRPLHPKQRSWLSVFSAKRKQHKVHAIKTPIRSPHSAPSPPGPASYLPSADPSTTSSHYTDSLLSYSSTNSGSTQSSDVSFAYSVTSINSYKSRKNVLYPRRAHPMPLAVAVSSKPPDALISQVQFLCTSVLPHTEKRLVPAGIVLLQALGLHSDPLQRVAVQNDEKIRCCSELFITLTHEVLLKDVINAVELEGPCKLLHM